MAIPTADRQHTRVRAITPADMSRILRLIESSWRVSIRLSPHDFRNRLKMLPGFLAEDLVGIRGVMMIDPAPPLAFLAAIGIRDTWHVNPYLELLLPHVEQLAQTHSLSPLVYIGEEDWLIEALGEWGFVPRQWIVTLERCSEAPPPDVPEVAFLRMAHRNDLSALTQLDALAFGEIWHKAIGEMAVGLAQAATFLLAELRGEIVGYAWCDINREHAHITRLAVHPNYQGRGIGAQLLHRVISDAQTRGVIRFTLNTQEDNRRSMALYRRFGFVPTGARMPLLVKDLL